MKRRFSAILLMALFAALFACTKSDITPMPIAVESVVLNKATTSILVGATETLSAVVTPTEAENKTVAWATSDAAIATVSDEGEVTAVQEGTAAITAITQDGGHKATCVVTVSATAVSVTGVTMNSETMTMGVAATATLTATIAPAEATNQNVVWSTSDAAVATVSVAGEVKTIQEGTATITAMTVDGGHKATCVVTVSKSAVSVTGVTLDPKEAVVYLGYPATAIIATVAPAEATNQAVAWSSSNESIATVSAEGMVTGVSVGTAAITAMSQDGAKTAVCIVTVSNPTPATGITLDKTTAAVVGGTTSTLVARVAPAGASNKAVVWSSSDESVATVSAEGVVTGIKVGKTLITATAVDGGHKGTCAVTVTAPILVTEVTLENDTEVGAVGMPFTLTATVAPADASNKAVVWSSSDESVATVSAEGVVTGIKGGTTLITATAVDGSHKGTSTVTIFATISVTGVTLDKATEQVYGGASFTLSATITPARVSNNAVAWSSSDESVATVSAEGVVTGIKAGTARITVTTDDGSRTAACAVTVTTYLEINGLRWAVGNLVATGDNSCRIGTPTDYGLFFQFGSLVGWNGGANGDGIGTGSPALGLRVRPTDYIGGSAWASVGRYKGGTTDDKGDNLPATDDPATGIGDPCRYYLGGTWRLPTAAEWLTLLGADGANTNKELPLKLTDHDLSFLPMGVRNSSNGTLFNVNVTIYGWSSSIVSATNSYSIACNTGSLMPQASRTRTEGHVARCVSTL